MKIALGSDHAGLSLKKVILNHLKEKENVEIIDVGTHDEERTHYPIFAKKAA
ncbi:MAG: RpiB/LacA/LacB family sugar-phosphate isomerase, partial [Halanaerobiales bacterium]